MEERSEQLRDQLVRAKRLVKVAEVVLQNLLQYGRLNKPDITRVMSGRFYYYVHFTERWRDAPHPHFPDAHPDGYVIIEGAVDADEARRVARAVLGRYHMRPVFEGVYKFPDAPLGALLKIQAEDFRRSDG